MTAEGRRATDAAAGPWEAAQSRAVEAFGVERWAVLHASIADLAAVGVQFSA